MSFLRRRGARGLDGAARTAIAGALLILFFCAVLPLHPPAPPPVAQVVRPAAAPKQVGAGNAPGGNPQLSPAQIRKMIEDAQKKQKDPHGGGGK